MDARKLAEENGATSTERGNVSNAADFMKLAQEALNAGDYIKFLTRLSLAGDFAKNASLLQIGREHYSQAIKPTA